MTKRLSAKVEEYQKDGQTKGKYIDLGVVMENQNGQYLLLDPTVNLAGVLVKQNALAAQNNQQQRSSVMVSVFDNHQQSAPQQNNYQQAQQGGFNQQAQQNQQGGYNMANEPNNQPPF